MPVTDRCKWLNRLHPSARSRMIIRVHLSPTSFAVSSTPQIHAACSSVVSIISPFCSLSQFHYMTRVSITLEVHQHEAETLCPCVPFHRHAESAYYYKPNGVLKHHGNSCIVTIYSIVNIVSLSTTGDILMTSW